MPALWTTGAATPAINSNENPAPTDPQPDSSGVHPSIRIYPEAPFHISAHMAWVKRIAQPVADKVHAQDRQGEQHTRHHCE